MALPVMVLSFARSDGVLDEWSMGNHHSGYTLHARSRGDGVGEAFPWLSKPFLQFYPIAPVLQHSTTPSTPGSEGTRSAPFQGTPDKAASSGRGFFIEKRKPVFRGR